MTKHFPFRYFKTSPEIIRLAVMLYVRFKVSEWGMFCHTERLRDHPARLKLVLSDSALFSFD
jgi:hypothetical protein